MVGLLDGRISLCALDQWCLSLSSQGWILGRYPPLQVKCHCCEDEGNEDCGLALDDTALSSGLRSVHYKKTTRQSPQAHSHYCYRLYIFIRFSLFWGGSWMPLGCTFISLYRFISLYHLGRVVCVVVLDRFTWWVTTQPCYGRSRAWRSTCFGNDEAIGEIRWGVFSWHPRKILTRKQQSICIRAFVCIRFLLDMIVKIIPSPHVLSFIHYSYSADTFICSSHIPSSSSFRCRIDPSTYTTPHPYTFPHSP